MTIFDTKSAADYLHCSQSHLTGLIRRGELKAVKVGRGYTIKQEWLDDFLETRAAFDTEKAKAEAVLPVRKMNQQPDLSRYLRAL